MKSLLIDTAPLAVKTELDPGSETCNVGAAFTSPDCHLTPKTASACSSIPQDLTTTSTFWGASSHSMEVAPQHSLPPVPLSSSTGVVASTSLTFSSSAHVFCLPSLSLRQNGGSVKPRFWSLLFPVCPLGCHLQCRGIQTFGEWKVNGYRAGTSRSFRG